MRDTKFFTMSLAEIIGKEATVTKTFSSEKTFGAYHEAEEWAKAKGYSVGRMDGSNPIGLKLGDDWDIHKWHNLGPEHTELLDGVIVGDMRHGPVTLMLHGLVTEDN